MATIKIKQLIAGRFWSIIDPISGPIDDMMEGPAIQHSKTQATFAVRTDVQLQIDGTKLKFAQNGDLIGGTITKLTYLDHGAVAQVATGLSLNAGTARIKYNQHETYPVDAHPKFVFDATGVTAPEPDDFGIFGEQGVDFAGWDGKDKIKGSPFDDLLFGLTGNDTIKGFDGDDSIEGTAGNDKLIGGNGDDTLGGNIGNDTLDGGGGSDVARIGQYSSSTVALKIDLGKGTATSSAYGKDKLISIENAIGDSGNDTFKGNGAANTFLGYWGKDSLDGAGGDDRLYGDRGHDTLKGGSGADTFAFNVGAADADHVKDFKPGTDTIELDDGVFTSLDGDSPLSDANFVLGKNAADADDFIIYNRAKGQLFYDPDGSGSQAKQLVATFDNKADLHASDFHVVAFGTFFWF